MDQLFARAQMATSLGFHIIFASIGITMPLLMCLAEWCYLRNRDEDYLALTKAWAKGTAVFFAVGAVSGTVLSFELGLLFPGFMRQAGPIIGLPFALEGFAFFTEAIFLGIYLYGWNRVKPAWHLASGAVVAVSGALSALFVTLVNAWMNAPTGFRVEGGRFVDIEPWKAMLSPFIWHEVPHNLVASYVGTAAAVAAIHAFACLRNRGSAFHRKALKLALLVLVPTSLVQPAIGHFAGQQVAERQPLKFASMESQFTTARGAPARLGGIPDEENRVVRWAVEIPKLLSFLATNSFDGEVAGLDRFPRADWPSPLVHFSFQIMVGAGTLLFLLALYALARWRHCLSERRFLWAVTLAGPLGFLAIETGWMVTEIGRQPWVIYDVMRTVDSITPMRGLVVPFVTFSLVYLGLAAIVAVVLRRHVGGTLG